MNLLIIEDEIKTAKELKTLIESQRPDMQVVDIVASVKSAVQWLDKHPEPDLIFSDIQLADGLSFEIYRQREVQCPIVFCTAFDEYAIQAFETNGIDYLLKPVDEEKLEHALAKFERFASLSGKGNASSNQQLQIQNLLAHFEKPYKTSLLVYYKEKIIPIQIDDILFFNSVDGVVTAHLNDGSLYVVNHTLESIESQLDPHRFYKANRQYIIARKAITGIEHYFTRRLVVHLSHPTPDPVIVSKVKASDFLKWVQQ
ncbi:MAG: response regulator transcription factor [Paludibacteraceae bacterium]|nr:response regulator transcription factor [Paludibacteraceae bacterium]